MTPTRSRNGKRWRYGTAAVAVLTLGVASACSSSSSTPAASGSSSSASASSTASGSSSTLSFPRNETLYTSGTSYSAPTIWNPLDTGNFATGAQGLIYEPLYLYDPVKGDYNTWLSTTAETSAWQANNTKFVFTVRSGVKWSDGTPLTAADVVFSMTTALNNAKDPYNVNLASVQSITASGNTVTVTFKGNKPAYTEFEDYLWKAPVLQQAQWKSVPASQINTWPDTKPIGTGPMTLDTANQQEVAYQTRPAGDWWANSALNMSFKFKYLVDFVNSSNAQEEGQLYAGQIDWSNNYLPGINALASQTSQFKFYYPQAQNYMMSGNTVWLEPNTTKAPMSNVNFRRALAYALNPSAIATAVYGGIATPSDPTGLLPTLQSAYVTPNAAQLKPLEATYNPAKAIALLKQSGYTGQTLTLEAPAGWSDWNSAQTVIASELGQVGIKVNVITPQYPQRVSDLVSGNYDLALDNNAALDTTPWSYFQRVYEPVASPTNDASQMNWERINSPSDWATVQALATTSPTDTATQSADYLKLEEDFLTQQPEIPLWYNGVWFQGKTQYWTNYPSSTGTDQNVPALWAGYIGAMTTVPALAQLTPAAQ